MADNFIAEQSLFQLFNSPLIVCPQNQGFRQLHGTTSDFNVGIQGPGPAMLISNIDCASSTRIEPFRPLRCTTITRSGQLGPVQVGSSGVGFEHIRAGEIGPSKTLATLLAWFK